MFRSVGCFLLLCLTLVASGQTRLVSHVTASSGGFTTSVVFENQAVTSRTITLSPYQADGTQLDSVTLELEGGNVAERSTTELFSGEVSHFMISGSSDISVGVNYNFQSGNGSPAFVAESSDLASGYRFFPGNWSNIFDGIAVVNLGDIATDVWISQKDAGNNVIGARKVASGLAPNAKALFVVGSPNDNLFTAHEGTFFEVTGDQLLGLTALRGTLPDATLGLLWSNSARPTSKSVSKRNEVGTWFIENGSMYDVHEMMGYNVAVDRLAQLEFTRRQGNGRLAELSPIFLDLDTSRRTVKYSDAQMDAAWAELSEENKVIYQAYINGINRRLGEVNSSLGTAESLMPVEFNFLPLDRFEAWTYHDVMNVMARIQNGFSLRVFGTEQIQNAITLLELQAKYGEEQGAVMFNDIRWTSDPASTTVLHKRDLTKKPEQNRIRPLPIARKDLGRATDAFRKYIDGLYEQEQLLIDKGIRLKMGSYSWVLSGSKTASGNPTIYAGPQTGFQAPMLMEEGSIVSDSLTISGMIIPGIPSFIMGRTPHHAWSMQVGHASSWDYYVVDGDQVRTDRTETIKVSDGREIPIDILTSDYGPVLLFGDVYMAFKYAHFNREFDLMGGITGMALATDMESFGTAVGKIGASQHVQYVDRDGNIAAWHSGITPVREDGDYRIPQGLLENQPVLEWDADNRIPMEYEANPPEGWYAGWNSKASKDSVDYAATTSYGPGHRGTYLQNHFRNADPDHLWTLEDIKEVAVDIAATSGFAAGGNFWLFFGEHVKAAVAADPTPAREAAMAMFDDWDQKALAGGRENWVFTQDLQDPALFVESLIPRIISKTFNDELGPPPRDYDFFYRMHTILHALGPDLGLKPQYDWFSNLEDPSAPQTATDIINAAIDETLAALGDRPWGIGARGTITYPHLVFGDVTSLLGLTPSPAWNRASYAQVVEYGPAGPVVIESLLGLGQSGQISGTLTAPVADPNVSSRKDDFDNFILRAFPLFN